MLVKQGRVTAKCVAPVTQQQKHVMQPTLLSGVSLGIRAADVLVWSFSSTLRVGGDRGELEGPAGEPVIGVCPS